MKEATRLLIENGIIPDSVVNMCRIWNGEDPGLPVSSGARQQQTQEELLSVVKRVAELLDADALPEIKESEPDLERTFRRTRKKVHILFTTRTGHEADAGVFVGFSSLGKLLVKVSECGQGIIALPDLLKIGNIVRTGEEDLRIIGIEPRYEGDLLTFYVCDVENVDA